MKNYILKTTVLSLLLFNTSMMANAYSVEYSGSEVGQIKNIETVNHGYLDVEIIGLLAKIKNNGKNKMVIIDTSKISKNEIKTMFSNHSDINIVADDNNYVSSINNALNGKKTFGDKISIKTKDDKCEILEWLKDAKNSIVIKVQNLKISSPNDKNKLFKPFGGSLDNPFDDSDI